MQDDGEARDATWIKNKASHKATASGSGADGIMIQRISSRCDQNKNQRIGGNVLIEKVGEKLTEACF